MAVHLGPLSPAPDRDVPSEVVRVLGKEALAGIDAHVHIRSGIDSLLGDTHLTVVAGKLHVIARRTSLDPLEDVPLLALPEIDEQGYRSVLELRTAEGDKRVEIGATEENAVHALVGALTAESLVVRESERRGESEGESESEGRSESESESEGEGRSESEGDRIRAAFVGLLETRLRQRKAKLRSDRAAHDQQKRKEPRPRDPVVLHAEVGRATTDEDGDGVPDPPGDRRSPAPRPPPRNEPPQQSSVLGLAVLTLLVMLGLLGAASRLLGK